MGIETAKRWWKIEVAPELPAETPPSAVTAGKSVWFHRCAGNTIRPTPGTAAQCQFQKQLAPSPQRHRGPKLQTLPARKFRCVQISLLRAAFGNRRKSDVVHPRGAADLVIFLITRIAPQANLRLLILLRAWPYHCKACPRLRSSHVSGSRTVCPCNSWAQFDAHALVSRQILGFHPCGKLVRLSCFRGHRLANIVKRNVGAAIK